MEEEEEVEGDMLDFPEINNVAAAALFGSISFLPPLRFVTERRLGSQ